MKACIYARTGRNEKGHRKFSIEKQKEHALKLAAKHGLTVAYEHVFTDSEYSGDFLPSCWVYSEEQEGRPALSSMITAIEEQGIKRIIVRRMERLGTSSEVLTALLEFFSIHDVYIIATPESSSAEEDPVETFAAGILRQRIQYDTDSERERRAALKKKKIEEIARLKAKIDRLEDEIAKL
jgi:DNA invertase Pin-like site-specific DNA recombinase